MRVFFLLIISIQMTTLTLLMNAEVDLTKKSIVLPKVSMQDFTTKKAAASSNLATPLDCLRCLLYYFGKDDKNLVSRILNENIHVNIRFKNQSLRCRKLRVYNPNAPGSVIAGSKSKSEQQLEQEEYDLANGDYLVGVYQDLIS